MKLYNLTPENTEFLIVSFEGPDPYSMAGGLGVRVANLSRSLAGLGFPANLLFVGDPRLKGHEVSGNLALYRWCQWISEYCPDGVYQGENEKLNDFNDSAPRFVVERIIMPALHKDKVVVVLGEEWHTAEAMCRISDYLYSLGMRDRVIMFWNANNTFSFDRIDWRRLGKATSITTVSRYMKHVMRGMGEDPLVIPNGIPRHLLKDVDPGLAGSFRDGLVADVVLSKVARWDPSKRWLMAVEAVARLKALGLKPLLLARGGIESHGEEVLQHARYLGLTVKDIDTDTGTLEGYCAAVTGHKEADILNLCFHCPQEFLRIIYKASDAVLANSGHEPFGLVGLEAMAAGGIAFTGGTGEDYATSFHNSITLETSDPAEVEAYLVYLREHPEQMRRMRKAAHATARYFTWEEVIKTLLLKLEYQARLQGLFKAPEGPIAAVADLETPEEVSHTTTAARLGAICIPAT